MIQTKYGNLLDAKDAIVHGCNCQGVMGSGVALQIRQKWPEVFTDYKAYYKRGMLHLGATYYVAVEPDVFVFNAMTQEFYGRREGAIYVSYEAVRMAFRKINKVVIKDLGIKTVNFPLIGCGLAGGDWSVVSSIIDEELDDSLEKVLWLQP